MVGLNPTIFILKQRTNPDRCFYINLPVGVVPLLIIIFLFRSPAAAKPQQATWKEKALQLDPVGTTLLIGAITSCLLAFQYGGQTHPWSSSVVIGLLVGSVAILGALVGYELWQGERAIFIPRLFKRHATIIAALYSILLPGTLHTMIYYLPIYFQAIRDSSAIMSGVENLPLIISGMLGALGAGIFISSTGLATPVMVACGAIGSIGCGLCIMLGMDTNTARWVGFQILAGFGLGAAFQVPVIVTQNGVDPADLSSATSLILSFQTVGSALLVSAAQTTFVNVMMRAVADSVTGVTPLEVVATGATELREVFHGLQLAGVLDAYLDGIRASFGLACAASGIAVLIGVTMPWKRLNITGGATMVA